MASRILHVLRRLYRKSTVSLQSLWAESHDRSELVATFMAVLELLKAKRVSLAEEDSEIVFLGRSREQS